VRKLLILMLFVAGCTRHEAAENTEAPEAVAQEMADSVVDDTVLREVYWEQQEAIYQMEKIKDVLEDAKAAAGIEDST